MNKNPTCPKCKDFILIPSYDTQTGISQLECYGCGYVKHKRQLSISDRIKRRMDKEDLKGWTPVWMRFHGDVWNNDCRSAHHAYSRDLTKLCEELGLVRWKGEIGKLKSIVWIPDESFLDVLRDFCEDHAQFPDDTCVKPEIITAEEAKR